MKNTTKNRMLLFITTVILIVLESSIDGNYNPALKIGLTLMWLSTAFTYIRFKYKDNKVQENLDKCHHYEESVNKFVEDLIERGEIDDRMGQKMRSWVKEYSYRIPNSEFTEDEIKDMAEKLHENEG